MKLKTKIAFFCGILILFGLLNVSEAKGGRGGGRGRGSRYGGKSSWSGGSWSSPSHSYSSSYSTSNSYTSGSYNSHLSSPGNYFDNGNKVNLGYGKTFGSSGLGSNTYIANNYYKKHQHSSGSDFLTNSLFYSAGMKDGKYYSNDYHRFWNENQDRKWRATTKGPYFANKVPSENEKILPASAVIGAAAAFGLASLLPLNVPANKPLMYCGNTDLMQSQIRIENGFIYKCKNDTFEVKCSRNSQNLFNSTNFDSVKNSTITFNENLNVTDNENVEENDNNSLSCERKVITCDEEKQNDEGIYCKNRTLYSAQEIYCNSTSILKSSKSNKTIEVLNCYKGNLPENQASFIPTTTTSTEASITTTTEKSLSIGAQMHIFMLKLLGEYEVLEKNKNPEKIESTTEIPKVEPQWIPKALEILPEITTESTTTTTTPEPPFEWKMKIPAWIRGGGSDYIYEDPGPGVLSLHYEIEKMQRQFRLTTTHSPWGLVKVYLTTTTEKNLITTTESSTTTIEEYSNSDEFYDFDN
ncbi:hypothetical protein PVAND_000184 [Polypedilum vanderplanki]|uniref:Uncharacterized protein n=1 Tax=Polypedilum vanderplanki TaxID=319348 RepID=A0A9J6BJA6_POLVA|nr:hypothetical protein PVAND_000184 [Polypedilum vanderplanki]